MSLTFSTYSTQREVIQAQGHSGSNQKSTGVLSDMSLLSRKPFLGQRRYALPSFPAAPRQVHVAGSVLFSRTPRHMRSAARAR